MSENGDSTQAASSHVDVFEKLKEVGTNAAGDTVNVTYTAKNGGTNTLSIPFDVLSEFISYLQAAGVLATKARVKAAGGDVKELAHRGFTNFAPTGYKLIKGFKDEKTPVIVLQFSTDNVPVADIVLDLIGADTLGRHVISETEKEGIKVAPKQ